jgi:hypothetical protein
MKRRTFVKNTGVLGLMTLVTPVGIFQSKTRSRAVTSLREQFKSPPATAKPHTWWHWMNGNVTKEGITLDLEAMQRVGIGGFQNFDAGTGIPKGPIEYLSPGWLELKKHAINEAERLGLEFTMHNCPGWSSSGGPWITPELSMQTLTWSESFVSGGKEISVKLPQPLSKLDFYKDICVIAYPSLASERSLKSLVKKISTSTGPVDLNSLDGDGKIIANTSENQSNLLIEFLEPREVSSISFISAVTDNVAGAPLTLQASNDGISFTDVAVLVSGGGFGGGNFSSDTFVTVDFPKTSAKYFRIHGAASRSYSQMHFSNVPKISDWQKRGNFAYNGRGLKPIQNFSPDQQIAIDSIVDVTSFVDKSGQLKWPAPAGNWTIIRFGHTSLGTMNRSAPDTGVGLECDKYSASAFEFHFNKMMENLLPSLKGLGEKGKVGLLIDSYEVGMQNWTAGFEKEFQKRNGYDLVKYLPAVIGRIVGNTDVTEKVLWDFRRTQGTMMADNYYGKFTELCHKNNILSYIQPYDRGPMEEMQIGSRIDINVAEFWNNISSIFQNNWTMRRTTKLSASIAHTNGQKIVAAESYTGEPESAKWQEHPFALKALGDKMFTQGLNRITFHRFAHQPHPTAKPGMTMGPWGIHFDRTNTWWEQGKEWLTYISRCQYLLQEGNFVADLLYFTGEDAGVYTKVTRDELDPRPPEGYDYDLINGEVLRKAKAENGKIVLPSGMSYRLLVIPPLSGMSFEILKKIQSLVAAGATVVGHKPTNSLGLQSISASNRAEFDHIVNDLWNGKISEAGQLNQVINELSIAKDFSYSAKSGDSTIVWIHRKIQDADVYFISNQRRTTEEIVCHFRITGKLAEKFDAVTGESNTLPIYEISATHTNVPLSLGPVGSAFVVFEKPSTNDSIVSVSSQNGNIVSLAENTLREKKNYAQVVDSFSITFWAKPETGIMLSTRNFMDGLEPWTDNYAIYPTSGSKIYGEGHQSCGVAVGRNGIALWHHKKDKPVFAFAAPGAISGWSHIAIVYSSGTPTIYVNGNLFGKSETRFQNVHPPGNALIEKGASFFNGDMTEPVITGEVLTAEKIKLLSQSLRPLPEKTNPVVSSNGGVLFWNDGNYIVKNKNGKESKAIVKSLVKPLDLSQSWTVLFPPNQGAPASITLSTLESLHKNQNEGVRYFSGTCTYQKQFQASAEFHRKGIRTFLDLGEVEVIAQIKLNGKNLGIFWARPFLIDVTSVVKDGANDLEVQVTNLWPNRLIGDEQQPEENKYSSGVLGSFGALANGAIAELPEWYKQGKPKPESPRVAFSTWKHYQKDSPLLESGLIGPVTLRSALEYLS